MRLVVVAAVAALLPLCRSAAQSRTASAITNEHRLRAENDSLRKLVDSLRQSTVPVRPPSAEQQPQDLPKPTTGPFGLAKGISVATLQKLVDLAPVPSTPGVYKATRVPKGSGDFESYTLVVGPHQGLCKIAGIGRNISTSSQGIELRSAFDRLESMVAERYGTGSRIDQLLPGSIWQEPNDFMMGLVKKERHLETYWLKDKPDAHLPPDIEAISLEANGLRSDVGYMDVSFEFNNFDACQKEIIQNPFGEPSQ